MVLFDVLSLPWKAEMPAGSGSTGDGRVSRRTFVSRLSASPRTVVSFAAWTASGMRSIPSKP